jgi:hypothetical protein
MRVSAKQVNGVFWPRPNAVLNDRSEFRNPLNLHSCGGESFWRRFQCRVYLSLAGNSHFKNVLDLNPLRNTQLG